MYLLLISVVIISSVSSGSDMFHLNSKITLYPNGSSSYFGYTVVLRNSSLIVGAPKATRIKDSIATGVVFICDLTNLEHQNVTCSPMMIDDNDRSSGRVIRVKDFFRDDMWFGATIATFPEDKLIVCAPRWTDPYSDKHLLAKGACYVETRRQGKTLMPLQDTHSLAFKTDGVRKEYGDYGTHLNFYAYGQAGMSIKVTENNSIIIGAPGLLQWTGGIIDYKFSSNPTSAYFYKQPTTNPYYTKELGPDDYLGYSVESGIFDENGSTLYVAGAPRSSAGFGQVFVFDPPVRVADALRMRAKVRGPQLGSYFGASLCCTDLNGDGRADLLVGAPNFVIPDDEVPYDQGAVFVFLAGGESPTLVLVDAGFVSGAAANGARFGSAVAALGDIDGDGFNDIAVGAPWEKDGAGAVYIYRGGAKGLEKKYSQRIEVENTGSFGMSISRGVDVDGNNCNDLAVGAHNSATAYLFRCVPSIKVHASIKIPDAMNFPKNVTNFNALFCVDVPPNKYWPHVKVDLQATITMDPEGDRAAIGGESEFTYEISAAPGKNICEEQVIEVKPTADLSKPILLILDLQPKDPLFDDSQTFHKDAARLYEDSTLHTSFLIQLIRDCGDDLICVPHLVMSLEALNSQYVPGTNDSLGVKLSILNKDEPAYGAQVLLSLPLPPKRVPGSCALEDLNMTCDVPAHLYRGETVDWEIELEYSSKNVDETTVVIKAELKVPMNNKHINEDEVKNVTIKIVPMAVFRVVGKVLPNNTVAVTREKFDQEENITFVHYFEITNLGPSDWSRLKANIALPENVSLSSPVSGCENFARNITCTWSLPAKLSLSLALILRYDLQEYGQYLEELTRINSTTAITLLIKKQQRLSVTTTLVLDPASPIWPHIVGLIAGLLLLAAIVFGLYKFGFFSRTKREELKKLIEETPRDLDEVPSMSSSVLGNPDDSTNELLSDDSD